MEIGLLCGEKTMGLSLPESVSTLEIKKMKPLSDPVSAVYEALANPIESLKYE